MYNNFSSKKTKKVISALLATALVVTGTPITADAATAKTVGVKKTTSVKVARNAKVTGLNSKEKKIVKVSVKGTKATIKGLKAGKATFKIGKKAYTVKVGATKVTVKAGKKTMKVGQYTVVRATGKYGAKDSIVFKSSNSKVVSFDSGKTKTKTANSKGEAATKAYAKKAGTVTVTAYSKNTGKKAEAITITVKADTTATATPTADVSAAPATDAPATETPATVAPTADASAAPATDAPTPDTSAAPTATPEVKGGASATVSNALKGYPNTVLVSDNAELVVTVRDKDGKPVSGKQVVFSISNPKIYEDEDGDSDPKAGYEVKGDTVVTTDAEGHASFVVGTKEQSVESSNVYFAGSVQFRASVVGSSDSVATGNIGFAAITPGTVTRVNRDAAHPAKELLKGTNAAEIGQIEETMTLSKDTTEYIVTQQVSKAGTDERAITFNVDPKIVLPATSTDSNDVATLNVPINEKSEKYGTYEDNNVKIVTLDDIDTSQLEYATLNFDKVQLSKYTKMTVACYSSKDCKTGRIEDSVVTISGEKEQSNFAYQIPTAKGSIKAIRIELKSAGQVQTNMNDGYSITNITGVYKKAGTSEVFRTVSLSTAKVEWEAVTPTYSETKPLVASETAILGINPAGESSTFEYQVPVFPNTGNARILERDKNGNVVSYYLAPTKNNGKNQNELSAKVDYNTTRKVDSTLFAYKATEKEATTNLKDVVTTSGNSVTVNSEVVGSINLKGTIKVDGLGSSQLNALNDTVYTSVQWNPLPNEKEQATVEKDAFLALAGQKITVYAQLTDANGNPVSLPGVGIDYYNGDHKILTTDSNVSGAAIVSNSGTTDVNGRTKLVLSASQSMVLEDLSAKSANKNYNVTLSIGEKTVKTADLYWVDANLRFTNSVVAYPNTGEVIKTVTTRNDSQEVTDAIKPTVGTPWEYAVKTIGDTLTSGKLDGYTIAIDGLNINMSTSNSNKGTYDLTEGAKGIVKATSEYENKDAVTARIDATSVTNNVKFTATKTNAETLNFVSVGEGSPNLNAKLTLKVDWQRAGTKIAMITPCGTNIAATGTSICVKVTDSTGKNVAANEMVKFTADKGCTYTNAISSGSAVYVKTNDEGVATLIVEKDNSNSDSSVITASVSNVNDILSTTINWIDSSKVNDFGVVNAAMKSGSTNQVVLTYNNDVLASSVVSGEFRVTGKDKDDKTVVYGVTDATVNGRTVTLTLSSALAAGQYTVAMNSKTVNGIEYNVVDEYGQKASAKNAIDFYSTTNAEYTVTTANNATAGKKDVTISGIDKDVFGADVEDQIVVTVDGEIVKPKITAETDGTYKFTVTKPDGASKKSILAVYFMGSTETKTVEW